jgi:hypothetical protein
MNFWQFLQDKNGEFSSKRLFGMLCLIAAFILGWQGRSAAVVACFTGPAAAVFIGQAVTKS